MEERKKRLEERKRQRKEDRRNAYHRQKEEEAQRIHEEQLKRGNKCLFALGHFQMPQKSFSKENVFHFSRSALFSDHGKHIFPQSEQNAVAL